MGDIPKLEGGDYSLPAIVKDPFTDKTVEAIWVRYDRPLFGGDFSWKGWVDFKNGSTSGRQDLQQAESLEDMVKQIRALFESIKK